MDTTIAVEIGNPASRTVTVHGDRFLIVLLNGKSVRTFTRAGVENISVGPGVTVTLELQFSVPGTNCSQEMRLDPNLAIQIGDRAINIDGVRFASPSPL
jgi:hypothetical protein